MNDKRHMVKIHLPRAMFLTKDAEAYEKYDFYFGGMMMTEKGAGFSGRVWVLIEDHDDGGATYGYYVQ